MRRKKIQITTVKVFGSSAADLRAKQSVRTTFKLSERAIDALSILSYQLGIKQKSLFDHLIDDMGALRSVAKKVNNSTVIPNRVAKTYVVSRKTLDNLEEISNLYATPRDLLVERCIQRIVPLIDEEKKKHAKRKKLHNQMIELLKKGSDVMGGSHEYLGDDDPVFNKYLHVLQNLENACVEMDNYLEKASKVERF